MFIVIVVGLASRSQLDSSDAVQENCFRRALRPNTTVAVDGVGWAERWCGRADEKGGQKGFSPRKSNGVLSTLVGQYHGLARVSSKGSSRAQQPHRRHTEDTNSSSYTRNRTQTLGLESSRGGRRTLDTNALPKRQRGA